jgi:hypothetical protein
MLWRGFLTWAKDDPLPFNGQHRVEYFRERVEIVQVE